MCSSTQCAITSIALIESEGSWYDVERQKQWFRGVKIIFCKFFIWFTTSYHNQRCHSELTLYSFFQSFGRSFVLKWNMSLQCLAQWELGIRECNWYSRRVATDLHFNLLNSSFKCSIVFTKYHISNFFSFPRKRICFAFLHQA